MDANELIAALDAVHGKTWHVYRTALEMWAVAIPLREHVHHVEIAKTFEGAILAATEWRDLPVIPRRPLPIGEIKAVRDGAKWKVGADGYGWAHNLKTKRHAEQCAREWVERSKLEREGWDNLYATIAQGVEGKDFRYAGGTNA